MEDKQFLAEFIALYQSFPCLWKISSKDYSNRVLKNNAYDVIVDKLKEKYPESTRDTAVRKISNLRTAYRRELRKKRDSLKSGEKYMVHLWYFDLLSFLYDQQESAEGAMDDEERRPKRKKVAEDVEATKLIKLACEKLESSSNPSKNIDAFAKSWSTQYDEMDASQKIIARKLISDVLFHGCMGNLQVHHTIEIHNILCSPNGMRTPVSTHHSFPNSQQHYQNNVNENSISTAQSSSSSRYLKRESTTHDSKAKLKRNIVPTPLSRSSSIYTSRESTPPPQLNDNAVYIVEPSNSSNEDTYIADPFE